MAKKVLVFLLVCVLFSSFGVWAGGTGEARGKPTIRYATWYFGGVGFDKTNYEQKIRAWAEKNKDRANFEFQVAKGDYQRTMIKADLAANNLPDTFNYWTRGSISEMVKNGLILDSRDYLKVSKKVKWEDFPEDAWKAFSFDGGKTVYGFPVEGSNAYFMANKKIFSKFGLSYPKTLEDLYAVSKVFNENGIVPVSVGSKGGNPGHFWYALMYYQYGSGDEAEKLVSGETRFDNPKFVKAAELCAEHAKQGIFMKDTLANGDFGPAVALYNEGKAAMIYCFPWMFNAFTPEIIKDSEMIDAPKMPGAVNDPSTFVVGGTNCGLEVTKKAFNDPKKQAVLVDFIDFLCSDEILTEVAASGRWADKYMDMDWSRVSPLYKMVYQFEKGRKLWINLWSTMPDPTAQEVYSYGMDELWALATSPKDFIDKVQKSMDKALKK